LTASPKLGYSPRMSDTDWDVLPMADPETISNDPRLRGAQLRINEEGRGTIATPVSNAQGASLDGPVPKYHTARQGLSGTKMEATRALKPKPRTLTAEELMAKAQQMLAEQRERERVMMAQGPAVKPIPETDHDARGMELPSWLTQHGR
jgi:hypothetical protein